MWLTDGIPTLKKFFLVVFTLMLTLKLKKGLRKPLVAEIWHSIKAKTFRFFDFNVKFKKGKPLVLARYSRTE